ncbi:hypothetical protein STEG23_036419 [Scotinomys teguina]
MGGRGSGESEAAGKGEASPAMKKTRCSSYRLEASEFSSEWMSAELLLKAKSFLKILQFLVLTPNIPFCFLPSLPGIKGGFCASEDPPITFTVGVFSFDLDFFSDAFNCVRFDLRSLRMSYAFSCCWLAVFFPMLLPVNQHAEAMAAA